MSLAGWPPFLPPSPTTLSPKYFLKIKVGGVFVLRAALPVVTRLLTRPPQAVRSLLAPLPAPPRQSQMWLWREMVRKSLQGAVLTPRRRRLTAARPGAAGLPEAAPVSGGDTAPPQPLAQGAASGGVAGDRLWGARRGQGRLGRALDIPVLAAHPIPE